MLQGHLRRTRTNHRKKQNSQLGWHTYLERDSVAQFLSCNVKKTHGSLLVLGHSIRFIPREGRS